MVVTDVNGEDVYVVMGLEQYESLVDVSLPDDEGDWGEGWWDDHTGLDKPSGDGTSAVPPASSVPEVQTTPSDIWEAMQPAGEPGDTWDLSKMSEVEKSDLERQFQEYQRQKDQESATKPQKTVDSVPVVAEAADDKKDEDFGEEQFYLEPVE